MIAARALVVAALLASVLGAPPAWAAGKRPLGPGDRIDLNHAPVVELMRLPGIGRTRAEAIAAARARSPFGKVEDVLAVKGLSAKWLEKQRAHVFVTAGSKPAPAPPVAPAKVTTKG